MSLRKFIGILAAMVLVLLGIGAATTPTTAATACPDKITVQSGSYVVVDVACFDMRVTEGGYHLFGPDADNPPALGELVDAHYTDGDGVLHNEVAFMAYPGNTGLDTASYVLRKGTTGNDFVTGSFDIEVVKAEGLFPLQVKVTKKLTKKRQGVVTFTASSKALTQTCVMAGDTSEPMPRLDVCLNPGEKATLKSKLRKVYYQAMTAEGMPLNWGFAYTKSGRIADHLTDDNVALKSLHFRAWTAR